MTARTGDSNAKEAGNRSITLGRSVTLGRGDILILIMASMALFFGASQPYGAPQFKLLMLLPFLLMMWGAFFHGIHRSKHFRRGQGHVAAARRHLAELKALEDENEEPITHSMYPPHKAASPRNPKKRA